MAVGHECSVKKEARLMKPTTINVTKKREEGGMEWQICLGVFLVVCVCFYSVFTPFALLLLLHFKLRSFFPSFISLLFSQKQSSSSSHHFSLYACDSMT